MKKPMLFLAVLLCLFTSCSRRYRCYCDTPLQTYNSGEGFTSEYTADSKDDAVAQCDAYEDNTHTNCRLQ